MSDVSVKVSGIGDRFLGSVKEISGVGRRYTYSVGQSVYQRIPAFTGRNLMGYFFLYAMSIFDKF